MQICGMGNTDFRSVFENVEWLQQNKEFINHRGLIYFTDGFGMCPAKKPDYKTAVVFADDNHNIPEVPPWAIKVALPKRRN